MYIHRRTTVRLILIPPVIQPKIRHLPTCKMTTPRTQIPSLTPRTRIVRKTAMETDRLQTVEVHRRAIKRSVIRRHLFEHRPATT